MKKISKLLALAAAVSTLFFASCSDVDTSGSVAEGTNDKTSNAKDYSVSFLTEDNTALDLSSYIAANKTSVDRSIIAAALDLDTSSNSNLFFYLWGTDALTAANSMTTPVKVDFTVDSTDPSKGKVTLDLASSKWNLVLAAATTDGLTSIADVKSKAYYIGYANVDLREADSIKFYLSTDGLNGTGKADITLVYDGLDSAGGTWAAEHVVAVTDTSAEKGYVITASVQLRTTGALADGTSELTVTNADFFGSSGATLTTISAAPGTYNFVVKFTSNESGKSYEWSDIIIFVPNQTITQTVKVPDIVMYAPDAPEAFKVGYVTPTSADKESYTAVLEWDDKSNNEKYFNVEIWNLPASVVLSAAIDDTNWDTVITGLDDSVYKLTLDDKFYGDIKNKGWVAGSLLKNNEHVALTLALGSRYIMRIASVNDAGTSPYCYATYDLDTAWADTDTYHTATYTPNAYVLKEIAATPASAADAYTATSDNAITASLFRLTYYLNGGTYTFDSGVTSTGPLVYYLSQDALGTGVPIFDPFNDPAAGSPVYPFLVRNGNRWTSWRDGILEGAMYTTSTATDHAGFTTFDPSEYVGCANLSLFASYTVASAEVEVYQHETYNFVDTELVITGTGSTKTADNYYVIDNKTAGTMQVAYTLKTGRTAFTYDSLTATITKLAGNSVVASGQFTSAGTYSFTTKQFSVGKYKLLIIGEYKGNQYSYNITLDIIES